jgi:micrococcal nuclease
VRLLAALVAVALVVALLVARRGRDEAEPDGRSGRVTHVVDGDTLDVGPERVRVLGIDTPERDECGYAAASRAASALALGRVVRLEPDGTQAARDRFGRTLAYVRLPDGRDLGELLLRQGLARTFVVGRPFARVEAYREAERAGRLLAPCST